MPRPFPDEAFGSWFGRLAARYRLTVYDLSQAANISLDFGPDCSSWLSTPLPAHSSLDQLSALCGLPASTIEAMAQAAPRGASAFGFCFRCLFMNPLEVESPYWHARWLQADVSTCTSHPDHWECIPATVLSRHTNMSSLTTFISRRRALRKHRGFLKSTNLSRASRVRGDQ